LPDNFKSLIAGSTSLIARSNGIESSVDYHVYRKTPTGLVSCSSSINAAIDSTSWAKTSALGTDDPSNCAFEAGDSLVFRIDLTAADTGRALVSNLDFAYNVK